MFDKFIHIYKKGTKEVTFCLFHGTGGDETDLIPIAAMIDPDASILGIRGNVKEHGMNRFFKRLAEGVFDEDDIIFQSNQLVTFLKAAEKKYAFDLKKTIFLGYSNGANIASSMLLLHPEIASFAILMRPVLPILPKKAPDLHNHSIIITAGEHDTIMPQENTQKLIDLLTEYKADVESVWLNATHGLTHEDIEKIKAWYEKKFPAI